MIYDAQRSGLEQSGYLHIPGPAHSWLPRLLSVMESFPAGHAHRNLLSLPLIRDFAVCEETLALIHPILGDAAVPVRCILFDKLAGANWKVAWHQDVAIPVKRKIEAAGFGPWSVKESVPHVQPPGRVLENMLTLRLHLDDCPPTNGPLKVLPGSHKNGILSHELIKQWREAVEAVAVTPCAGGILLMRPLLLHASSAAEKPTRRRVLHVEYTGAPLPPPLEWQAA